MIISDKVYGKISINEPVLAKLINSKPLQRIKGVNQAGSQLVFPQLKTTRYDHCVGVMVLLRLKGASVEEQIAGLLHDVPHTVFSHAMDFLFGRQDTADYHEQFLKKIVFESEIPQILRKFGFDTHRVTDEHNFPLLEQPLPSLCADRIDYTFRDMLTTKSASQKKVKELLDAIVVFQNRFAFSNPKQAAEFAQIYYQLSESSWISAKTLATFLIISEIVKIALKEKIVTEKDLFTTDSAVLKKLNAAKKQKIQQLLKLLTPKLTVTETQKEYNYKTTAKVRYIDPPVLVNGTTQKTSVLNKQFAKNLKAYLFRMDKTRYLRILTAA